MTNEILIIDDNSDIRQLISGILRDKGFIVREAANFDQAMLEINKKLPIENLIHFMNYRYHPIVFNIFDNYCLLCNQGIIFYNEDEKLDSIQCNHNI